MPEKLDRADSFQDQNNFLESSIKLFRYYKGIGEKAIDQLSDEQVLQKPNEATQRTPSIWWQYYGERKRVQ